MTQNISQNINQIKKRISAYEQMYGREDHSVKLIAVSKYAELPKIKEAINAGQLIFGENKVQDSLKKWKELKESNSKLELHFIGNLQSNKVKEAVGFFDYIHSIDSLKLAEIVKNEAVKINKNIPCFIQINIGEEAQKSGALPQEAEALINHSIKQLKLNVVGLMCIPPLEKPSFTYFGFLKQIAKNHNLKELSMGMSHDYNTAIAFGATYVRIGSAIFQN